MILPLVLNQYLVNFSMHFLRSHPLEYKCTFLHMVLVRTESTGWCNVWSCNSYKFNSFQCKMTMTATTCGNLDTCSLVLCLYTSLMGVVIISNKVCLNFNNIDRQISTVWIYCLSLKNQVICFNGASSCSSHYITSYIWQYHSGYMQFSYCKIVCGLPFCYYLQ